MSHPNLEWTNKYMSALEGKTITKAGATLEDGAVWPFFVFELEGGFEIKVEVSRDEEGNGPGFLFGLPMIVSPVQDVEPTEKV